MNHAQHDLDRIAGYANGLDNDSDLVATQIAACVLCRQEYEAQVSVKNLLAQMPPVMMTPAERTTLRTGVHARLSASPQPVRSEPTLAEPSPIGVARARRAYRSTHLWTRIGAVAAGMLVVVGAGSVWRDLAGVGATAATTTTSAVVLAAEASPDYYAGAPAETTAGAAALDQAQRSVVIDDMTSLKAETERLAQTVDPVPGQASVIGETAAVCPAVIADRMVLAVEEATFADEPILIYIVGAEGGTEAIIVKVTDCTVVDLDD